MKPFQSNKNQSTPKKGGIQGTKMEGPTSKKTKNPPKKANHKGKIKFLNSEKHIK
jgi:hypothetical protein